MTRRLRPDGALSPEAPGESAPDRYRYDPDNPTPAAGGVRASGGGRVDNAKLEARPDVLTYTTPVLDRDIEVIGEVSAEIWFQSSLPYADVTWRTSSSTRWSPAATPPTWSRPTRCPSRPW